MIYSPDFGFEQDLRRLLVDELQTFDLTSKTVNENPRFAEFRIRYNTYQQYIRDILSLPESVPFVGLLVGFELLIKLKQIEKQLGDQDNTLPIAISLIRQLLERVDSPVSEIVSDEVNKILDKLEVYENDLKDFYVSDLKNGLDGLELSNTRIAKLHEVLIGDPAELADIILLLNNLEARIKQKIVDVRIHFDGRINEVVKDFNETSKKYKDEVIETVCEEIPNRVVGESYYRYNATSQFYPTLMLVFVEMTENKYPRRSQMKVKIKKETAQVTDLYIEELRKRFRELHRKQYRYGAQRACYVSSDKTYKNTLFCSNLGQAEQVFQNVYRLVDLPYDPRNISITSGRNRKPVTRRSEPLDGQIPKIDNYNEEFEVSLYRAVLHVNGMPKPILIYKNYRIY